MLEQNTNNVKTVLNKLTISFAILASLFLVVAVMGFFNLVRYHQAAQADQARLLAAFEKHIDDVPADIRKTSQEIEDKRNVVFDMGSKTLLLSSLIGFIFVIMIGLLVTRNITRQLRAGTQDAAPVYRTPGQTGIPVHSAQSSSSLLGRKQLPSLALITIMPVLILIFLTHASLTRLEGGMNHLSVQMTSTNQADLSNLASLADQITKLVTTTKLTLLIAGLLTVITSLLVAVVIYKRLAAPKPMLN